MNPPAADPPIAAAVIVADRRVLLVRRRAAEGDLSWQFPAGKVEPGESPEAAAVRETHEETGLTVTARTQLGQRTHPSTGRTIIYIACEILAGTAHVAAPDEIADITWSDLATLTALIPHPPFGPVHEYVHAKLT